MSIMVVYARILFVYLRTQDSVPFHYNKNVKDDRLAKIVARANTMLHAATMSHASVVTIEDYARSEQQRQLASVLLARQRGLLEKTIEGYIV